jgi:glucokinase
MSAVSDVVLGVDAGGTKLLGGLVTREGEVLDTDEVPTPRSPEGCDPGLRALSALAARLADVAAAAGHRIVGIGLGFPEYVRDGVVSSAEVFAWDRQPAEVLAEVLPGLPVTVEGDVLCAAAAEARARSMRPGSSLFYVSWGTGLSSSLVLGDVPLRGRRGEALAFGEWPVAAAVDSGWRENLERYAAGLSLGRRYRQRTGEEVDGRTVVRRSTDGDDPVADDIVDSVARALAHALAQVVHLLDPDVIVLGGGLGTSGTRPPRLVAELLPSLLHRPDPPPVEPAVAGPRAGLVGAGLLATAPSRARPAGRTP